MKPTPHRRVITLAARLVVVAAAFTLQAAPARAAGPPDPAQTARLHALFDAKWEADMRRYPDYATYVGDHRYGDRLYDATPATRAAEFAAARAALAQAQAIRRDALSPPDQVSLDVFIDGTKRDLSFEPFAGYRSMSLGARGGFQSDFAELLAASPVANRAQVEQMLARMAAYPKRVDQELLHLREGMALGWVPPRNVLDRVLAQLDAQLAPAIESGPFFLPFTKLGSDISAAEQSALRAAAVQAIDTHVLPALRRLRRFVADDYMAGAPADGALSRYPGGDRAYAALLRAHTTTELSAAQIHAIGLRELSRLRSEMEAAVKEASKESGSDGDFARFVEHLNTDPKFFHTGPDALLAGYREIAKRIDPELPRLFAVLPRAPYGVRAMPAHMGAEIGDSYDPPTLDGTRPGWFNANAQAWRIRPIWSMEWLVAHEAVPGHHLQFARAAELGELPRFRRSGGYTVYGEGWALYAETLGFELGLYKDPNSRFGHLQAQAFRAARLVVDTGLHAFGWTRQQSIDFMVERTGQSLPFVTSEVDRYYSWPGQALAYMIGELKIIELRDRAKAALGARFDIRRFHGVVLDLGSVPLPVLEREVDEWIAAGGG